MSSTMSAGRRWLVACMAVVAFGLLVAGCGSDSDSDSTAESSGGETTAAAESSGVDVGTGTPVEVDGEPTSIALFVATTLNEYNQAFIKSAEETAKAEGASIQVFDSAFDPTEQVNQIANAMQSKKFNTFIVQPVDTNAPCQQLTTQAPDSNVLVSVAILPLCDRVLDTGEELWAPGTLNFVGGQAQMPAYEAWAEKIIEENPGPQKVLLLSAEALNGAAKAFNQAVLNAAKSDPEFEILEPVETDYTTPTALAKTQNALQANPDITIVLAILSDVTKGAISALKSAGKQGQVKVYDVGASKYSLEEIEAGELVMSMPYFPASAAAASVKSLVEARNTGEPGPRSISDDGRGDLGEFEYITKQNVSKFEPEY